MQSYEIPIVDIYNLFINWIRSLFESQYPDFLKFLLFYHSTAQICCFGCALVPRQTAQTRHADLDVPQTMFAMYHPLVPRRAVLSSLSLKLEMFKTSQTSDECRLILVG